MERLEILEGALTLLATKIGLFHGFEGCSGSLALLWCNVLHLGRTSHQVMIEAPLSLEHALAIHARESCGMHLIFHVTLEIARATESLVVFWTITVAWNE